MTTPERDENDDLIKRMLEAFYPSTSLNGADLARVTPFMQDAALVLLERLKSQSEAQIDLERWHWLDAFARAHGLEDKS